jgi:hypothetical protein
MQEAGDLSLQLGHFRKVDERRRAFEELPLNFGQESAPSHDDGRSQTFNNLLFFGEKLIRLVCEWHESLPSSSHPAIHAEWWRIGLRTFP